MICINKIIYLYNSNNESLMHIEFNNNRIQDIFKFEEMYRKILNKKKEEKYIIGYIKGLIKDLNIIKNSIKKTKIDIKHKLINLLKIYVQDYQISNDIIFNFISLILNY